MGKSPNYTLLMSIKTSLIILALLVGTSLQQRGTAQELSKEEKKALKAELKKMKKNPELYKTLKVDLQENKSTASQLNSELRDVNSSISSTKEKLDDKDTQIKALEKEISQLKDQKNEINNFIQNETATQGLVYRVQVEMDEGSLYKEMDRESGVPRKVFTGDNTPDGRKFYTIGEFTTREEAEAFKQGLSKMRIQGVFVAAYENGQRVQ